MPPFTIRTTTNPPREYRATWSKDATHLFQRSCNTQFKRHKRILQTSFRNLSEADHVSPYENGFVKAAFLAYSNHHHLHIRPEDVWFSILSQISFYVNKHAEELRSSFVSHEGKKEVEVTGVGSIDTADVGKLAVELTSGMGKYLNDKTLREWVLPDFTTTTEDDTVIAAIIMMGTMQKYFEFKMSLVCGIPSVTLLGEREDWVKIRNRLDRITKILSPEGTGTDKEGEPAQFATQLRFVLDNFIRSIDEPEDEGVAKFWSHIASHVGGGSGPTWLSGWITAFCFWKSDGERPKSSGFQSEGGVVEVLGTTFHPVDTADIPEGYVEVPVTVDDNGNVLKTQMVAGSVGVTASSSGDFLDESKGYNEAQVGERTGLDTVQPRSGWWMYELKEEEQK